MGPLTGPAKRCATLWRSLGAALLLALGACVPRAAAPPPGDAAAPPPADALPAREPALRVGLLVDTARVQLSAPAGLELVDPGTGGLLRQTEPGTAWTATADATGRLRLAPAAGGTPLQAPASGVLARPRDGGIVEIGGRPYRGAALVRSAGPGRVTAINQLDMEAYLLGVVPREIGRVGEDVLEAAKAQAVAARTYAVRYLGRRAPLGFDVYATVQDQVYGGVEAEHDPVSRAVRETAGEILTYGGEPIEAFYHSTCAGHTAAIEEVWDAEPRPYLVAVEDVNPRIGEAYDASSSRFRWTVRWDADELRRILSRTLADSLPRGASDIGELRSLDVRERTPSGRIGALRISTATGDYVVGGDRIRWILRTPEGAVLNSSRFEVRLERGASGELRAVVAEGGGWGHGIGMCQVGAMGRARAGQDYRTILGAYYPNTRLRDLY